MKFIQSTYRFWPLALFILPFAACQKSAPRADAYGNFEADERLVSAEAAGKIVELRVEEGQDVQAGQVVGRVDSAQIVLRIEQLQASKRAVAAKSPAIGAQLAVFEKQLSAVKQQLATLDREKRRVENLLNSDAATPKQLDDLNAQIEAAQRQMDVILEQKTASNASLDVQKGGLLAEILPLEKQIAQLEDQLAKCRIASPTAGTVLTKYADAGEVTAPGKPIFKVAEMGNMVLRAYVSGAQLGEVSLGRQVRIFIDDKDPRGYSLTGSITWVSPKAEFTPKVIQTKDERVNLVYAIKINVPNADRKLKIGMPGEVYFN